MGHEGTLADPRGVPSCPVCDGSDPNCTMHQFPDTPYPSDYPFLPDRGGYERDGESTVQPKVLQGARRKRMRWRS